MSLCIQCGKEVDNQGAKEKKFCTDSCRYTFHNKNKKKKWTLKSLASHYRKTGEYLPEAEALEEIYIMSIADEIEHKHQSYIESPEFFTDEFPLSLENRINIEIGIWQANNGFVRPFTQLIKELK